MDDVGQRPDPPCQPREQTISKVALLAPVEPPVVTLMEQRQAVPTKPCPKFRFMSKANATCWFLRH